MAVFIVIFQNIFLSVRSASLLIRCFNLLIAAFANGYQIPSTLSTVEGKYGFDALTKHVKRFVVCPKCHYVYTEDVPRHCSYVRFPEPRSTAQRTPCNAPLYQSARSKCPNKVFAYNSLIANLTVLFNRLGFEKQINEWRARKVPTASLFDVYDGRMWYEIRDADSDREVFVEHNRSLLLTLNVDWFRPFSGVPCSWVAIYFTINNLPRSVRYRKNVILVGIMPGPKEPKTYDINNYLKSLVDELRELYTGVRMTTFEQPKEKATVRAARGGKISAR